MIVIKAMIKWVSVSSMDNCTGPTKRYFYKKKNENTESLVNQYGCTSRTQEKKHVVRVQLSEIKTNNNVLCNLTHTCQ